MSSFVVLSCVLGLNKYQVLTAECHCIDKASKKGQTILVQNTQIQTTHHEICTVMIKWIVNWLKSRLENGKNTF